MSKQTLYEILDISTNASEDEIKKAYRKMSLKYHPDKNKNDPTSLEKFHAISEAYETLSEPNKKQMYDYSLKNKNPNMNQGPFMGNMGMGNMGNHMNMFHTQSPEHLDAFLSNIFSMGFSGDPFSNKGPFFAGDIPINVSHFNSQLLKPSAIIKTIEIPIEDIYENQTLPIEIERWINDRGKKIFEKETIYVNIPQGVDDNEIIILREKGNISGENCVGDIKIFIKIINSSAFTRKGLDLQIEKTITLKEALCGFSFDIIHLNRKMYTINNDKGNIIKPNYKKIIPKLGLYRDNKIGNLNIVFTIIFPDKLKLSTINKLTEITFE